MLATQSVLVHVTILVRIFSAFDLTDVICTPHDAVDLQRVGSRAYLPSDATHLRHHNDFIARQVESFDRPSEDDLRVAVGVRL